MVEVSQTVDRCLLTTGALRVELQFVADRWQHTVYLQQSDVWRPVLESVEGTATERFPPSPAFQEILLEDKPDDCHEVQLFGQAGKNLYAAAISLDGAAAVIDFDVSVRMRGEETPSEMVSTYRTGDGFSVDSSALPESALFLHPEAGKLVLSLESTAGSASNGMAITAASELQVGCLEPGKESGTALRWQYRISEPAHA